MPAAPTTRPAALSHSRSPVSRIEDVTVSPHPKRCVVKVLSAPQPGPPVCRESRAQSR